MCKFDEFVEFQKTNSKEIKEYKSYILKLIENWDIEKIECKQECIDITQPGDIWRMTKPGRRMVTFIEKRR